MRSRRLVLHAGGPKTGSSALQHFLLDNADALKVQGYAYRNARIPEHDHQVISGNGGPLLAALRKDGVDDATIDAVITSYFDEACEHGLISAEGLCTLGPGQWSVFTRSCERLEVTPSVIFYARDVYPYYQSNYHQGIKRGGIACSFEEYALSDRVPYHSDHLRVLTDVFGAERCRVIHYESHRAALDAPFLEALGLVGQWNRRRLSNQINRSLTRQEADILRRVNRRHGTRFCSELSNRFVTLRPDDAPSRVIEPRVAEGLARRRGACLHWMNHTFFSGEEVIKLVDEDWTAGEKSASAPPAASAGDPLPAAAIDAVDWALDRIVTSEADLKRIVTAIMELCADRSLADHPALPPDFDPVDYLLLHRDVLRQAVNPYLHFVQHGRFEHRIYRL